MGTTFLVVNTHDYNMYWTTENRKIRCVALFSLSEQFVYLLPGYGQFASVYR